MLLVTRGRRSGELRPVAFNYALFDGGVWCLAGWGERTQWDRNLLADPRVEVRLPLRTFVGRAEPVTDRATWLRGMRAVARGAGWAGFTTGLNPWTAHDEVTAGRCGAHRPIRAAGSGCRSWRPA